MGTCDYNIQGAGVSATGTISMSNPSPVSKVAVMNTGGGSHFGGSGGGGDTDFRLGYLEFII